MITLEETLCVCVCLLYLTTEVIYVHCLKFEKVRWEPRKFLLSLGPSI